MLGQGDKPILSLHKRIRTLLPKCSGTLTSLHDGQGGVAVTPQAIDIAIRHTRQFWNLPPQDTPSHLLDLLNDYSSEDPFPVIPFPHVDSFVKVILHTPDSAAGLDGVPYAAYRVLPDLSAHILSNLLSQSILSPTHVRKPQQLLVWIPKAEVGQHADNWRPLGMPPCAWRIISATVFGSIASLAASILHPSQALLNSFREPQGNFLTMQNWLLQLPTKKSRREDGKTGLEAVMLTDMEKAFEWITPEWIIQVLLARRAPHWIVQYARFTLFGRVVRAKIK